MTLTAHSPEEPTPTAYLDEPALIAAVIGEVLLAPLQRLEDVTSQRPAMYLLALTSGELYEPILATGSCLAEGGWPVRAGSARCARERLLRYRISLRGAHDLDVDDVRAAVIEFDSHGLALWAEHWSIALFRPAWNEVLIGAGNHRLGGSRTTQAPSRWACAHGATTGATGQGHDAHELRDRVTAHLAATVPSVAQNHGA